MSRSPNGRLIDALDRFDEDGVLEALRAGADPNRFDAEGNAPLYRAIANIDGWLMLKTLVEHGADINAICKRTNRESRYPIQFAIMCGKPWILEFLIENGVDIHLHEGANGNLLHVVAANDVPEIDIKARLLLNAGLDPDALNFVRRKPWEQAFCARNFAATEVLLEPCEIDRSAMDLAYDKEMEVWLQARMDVKRLSKDSEDIPLKPKSGSRVTL